MYHHNPNQTPRKRLRLENYDYSSSGLYFITISVQNKLCLFGEIKNNKMEKFESAEIIEKYWLELENKFGNVKLHNFVVMPNHFHGIIEIVENKKSQNIINNPVGADLCVCPDAGNGNYFDAWKYNCPDGDGRNCPDIDNCSNNGNVNNNSGQTHRSAHTSSDKNIKFTPTNGEYIYNKNSISSIIQWYKTMTTNAYIKLVYQNKAKPFNKKLWQRNFYDNIIKNEEQYFTISKYID